MRAQIRRLAAAAALFCSAGGAWAEQAGGIFNAGANARPLGMGGAYTAVVEDGTSLYYNPGGMGRLQHRQISLLQATLFGGAAYQYINYSQPWRGAPGGWGLEILKLGVSGIKGRDNLNQSTGDLSYAETGFGFGGGWRGVFLPEISMGFRVKMLKRALGPSSDSLTGVDVGGQYGPFFHERMMVGAVLQNVVRYQKGDTQDTLQPALRLGASYRVFGPLAFSCDIAGSKDFSFGTEYQFGHAALRMGMMSQGYSFGAGLIFRSAYSFDLAVVQSPTLGMSQRVSLGFKFGARRKDKETRNELAAKEYFDNGAGELERGHYLAASKSYEMALALDPRLGENGVKTRVKRLRQLVAALEIVDHPEYDNVFGQESVQGRLGRQAVQAFMDRDDDVAMLFAHVSAGQDPKSAAHRQLLDGLGSLTRRPVNRDDMLPADTLADRRLQQLTASVYARKYDEALRFGREAVLLAPSNALAWTRLGSTYFAAGDKNNAKAAYRKALELEPTNQSLRQFMTQQGFE